MRWVALLAVFAAGGSGGGRSIPAARTHTIEMRRMAFHPETLTVTRGDTIVWINRDIVPHTATAVDGPPWDTGRLLRGAAGHYVPRRAGRVAYTCTLHPSMRGTLLITLKEPS